MMKVFKNKTPQLTQRFGNQGHLGMDLVGYPNLLDDVVCCYDGVVEESVDGKVKNNNTTGVATYGNYVLVNHNNGYKTRYAHLAKGSVKVKKGDRVSTNQELGYMGDSGNTYGAHLHFEMLKDNQVIDAYSYIFEGKTFSSEIPSGTTYRVVAGDTLTSIARKYQVTVDDLIRANKIENKDFIVTGTVLKIPKASTESTYTVKAGDTLYDIARRYNTDWKTIYEKNKSIIGNDPSIIKVGQKLTF